MNKNLIGLNAGKVWRILNEKGELSMFELCRELGLTFEEVAVAIGWLARENKISFTSPLGKALIGKEEGDTVIVKAPKGDVEFEIESFEFID